LTFFAILADFFRRLFEDLADGLPNIAAGSHPSSDSGPEESEESDGPSSRSRFVFFLFEVRALMCEAWLAISFMHVVLDQAIAVLGHLALGLRMRMRILAIIIVAISFPIFAATIYALEFLVKELLAFCTCPMGPSAARFEAPSAGVIYFVAHGAVNLLASRECHVTGVGFIIRTEGDALFTGEIVDGVVERLHIRRLGLPFKRLQH
jgi:hypothetical protein